MYYVIASWLLSRTKDGIHSFTVLKEWILLNLRFFFHVDFRWDGLFQFHNVKRKPNLQELSWKTGGLELVKSIKSKHVSMKKVSNTLL